MERRDNFFMNYGLPDPARPTGRCLKPVPDRRYGTADGLLFDLRRI